METSMAAPVHPGTIVYFEGAPEKEVSRMSVSEVPESLRFAQTEHGLVPVVKVVAYVEGDQRYIREYGPDGELLRTTMQVKA